jgi:hypothetical protein
VKQIADNLGESFKVTLANGDYVQVSPPVQAEFKGNIPVIVTEAPADVGGAERRAGTRDPAAASAQVLQYDSGLHPGWTAVAGRGRKPDAVENTIEGCYVDIVRAREALR